MMSPCITCLNAGLGTFSHMGLFISLAFIREEESQSPESLSGIRTPPLRALDLCSPKGGEALAPPPPPPPPTWQQAHPRLSPSPRLGQLRDPPPSPAGQVLGDIRAGLPPGDATWPRPALDRRGSRTWEL